MNRHYCPCIHVYKKYESINVMYKNYVLFILINVQKMEEGHYLSDGGAWFA